MIIGAHTVIYSEEADEVRTFLRDVLNFNAVDAGGGWLVFALPPAELAVHPGEGDSSCELYLMCDNLDATIKELSAKGVEFAPVTVERWGTLTSLTLPGGGQIGLYEPNHPTAI
ncbi:MAG TPA: extradiol dioxygenase [Rugosimonospora sp.]|nr:extradiol dioxygenase [Rugosimonospora sp.]